MSYLDWHVGMKVVCIKHTPWKCQNPWVLDAEIIRLPSYREVCAIAEFYADDDGVYIILEGFDSKDVFNVRHFRPVQTRTTDISIFTQMLNPSKVDA